MGSFTITHWIVVAIVVLVLFGRGKISETMGDFGKGIRSFRAGMSDEEKPAAPPQISAPAQTPAATTKTPETRDA